MIGFWIITGLASLLELVLIAAVTGVLRNPVLSRGQKNSAFIAFYMWFLMVFLLWGVTAQLMGVSG